MDNLGPLPPAPATVEVITAPDGETMVHIGGELDMSSVDRLETEMERILAETPPRLVVDVRGVSFADSSAIAMWVRWAGAVPNFELRNAPPLVCGVIRTMGLESKLGMVAS